MVALMVKLAGEPPICFLYELSKYFHKKNVSILSINKIPGQINNQYRQTSIICSLDPTTNSEFSHQSDCFDEKNKKILIGQKFVQIQIRNVGIDCWIR